jgi:hypothetical protein
MWFQIKVLRIGKIPAQFAIFIALLSLEETSIKSDCFSAKESETYL